jgi:mannitol-1-phosphate 5-dehydrogenase
VDKDAFKGEIPAIKNMVPFAPFDFYLKRKLYIHNMGHATCAYLGDLLGLEYIYQSIDVADVRILVQNAMIESAVALSKKYGVPMEDIVMHITDLLNRFTNAALMDTCARVGGDPGRKLSPDDRLIGSSTLALAQGITPAYIAVGAAAGLRRYINEAEGLEQGMDAAKQVLREVSKLDTEGELAKLILNMYEKILAGATLYDLRCAADAVKASTLKPIV